jgi:hypothetical protein
MGSRPQANIVDRNFRTAPNWQSGFFDHLIRHDESYRQKWEYVVENPVRASLVNHSDERPWQGEIERIESIT